MNQFIEKYGAAVAGVLSGFDRLVFKGSLRRFCFGGGIRYLLHTADVLLKDYKPYVHQLSQRVRAASVAECERLERPLIYLPSSATSKEDTAREIQLRDNITEGLICVLGCVESCNSFDLVSNKETKRLEIVNRPRKCLHLYHYYVHPLFGFMSARLQTWLPLGIQICMNGREWLSREMDRAGMSYVRQGNCFPWVQDFSRAQEMMSEQPNMDWPVLLAEIAGALNPEHEAIFEKCPADYYWSTRDSEWATDIVFGSKETLKRLYPLLVQHGMSGLGSPDVMRFLGRKLTTPGAVNHNFQGEVVSDMKRREEGVRIKHRVNRNSVKLYDKVYSEVGSVLRAETTINNADDFKVERTILGDPEGKVEYRRLRRGVVDLPKRALVSQQSNDRYLDAFASVDSGATMQELVGSIAAPTTWNGKRVRAINPFAAGDLRLLEAVSRGEFSINGLRNRDLQSIFFEGEPATPQEARRRSAWVTRQLRLLRAHGILTKVEHSHRYQLTDGGRMLTTALLTARNTPVRQLLPAEIYQKAA